MIDFFLKSLQKFQTSQQFTNAFNHSKNPTQRSKVYIPYLCAKMAFVQSHLWSVRKMLQDIWQVFSDLRHAIYMSVIPRKCIAWFLKLEEISKEISTDISEEISTEREGCFSCQFCLVKIHFCSNFCSVSKLCKKWKILTSFHQNHFHKNDLMK